MRAPRFTPVMTLCLVLAWLLAACASPAGPAPASPTSTNVAQPATERPVSPTPPTPDSAGGRPLMGQDFEGAILPPKSGPDFGLSVSGFWQPDEAAVIALEDGLEAYLTDAGQAELVERLPTYQRQYVGIERDGQRLVYANFFCDPLGIDWQTAPVVVEDGGNCYFQVEYNPESGEFTHLTINGEA